MYQAQYPEEDSEADDKRSPRFGSSIGLFYVAPSSLS
jgi:hypothetical protein